MILMLWVMTMQEKPYKITVTVNAVQVANDAYVGWAPDYPVGWLS